MGFLIAILYIAMVYLSPAYLFPGLTPLRPMIWLAALGTLGCGLSVLMGKMPWTNKTMYLLAAFFTTVPVSRAAHLWFGGAFYATVEVLPSVAAFFLVMLNFQSIWRLRVLVLLLFGIAFYYELRGFEAYVFHPTEGPFLMMMRAGYTDVGRIILPRIRGVGILSDPNDLAQFFVILLPFLGLLWDRQKPFRNIFLVVFPLLLIMFGVYMTRSRGALIGLGVAMVMAAQRRIGRVGSVMIGILGVLVLLLLNFAGGRELSFGMGGGFSRLEAWSNGLTMFKSSPLFGIGYGLFTDYYTSTAHNSFVLCLAELGSLGYFLWLGLLLITWRQLDAIAKGFPCMKLDDRLRAWAEAVRNSFVVYLVTAAFLSRLYEPTLYVLIGMAVVLTRLATKEERIPIPEPRWHWSVIAAGLSMASIVVIYVVVNLRTE